MIWYRIICGLFLAPWHRSPNQQQLSLTYNVFFAHHDDGPCPCWFMNDGNRPYLFIIIARLVDFATEKIVTSVSRTCGHDGQGILPKSELFLWRKMMSFWLPKQRNEKLRITLFYLLTLAIRSTHAARRTPLFFISPILSCRSLVARISPLVSRRTYLAVPRCILRRSISLPGIPSLIL